MSLLAASLLGEKNSDRRRQSRRTKRAEKGYEGSHLLTIEAPMLPSFARQGTQSTSRNHIPEGLQFHLSTGL